MGQNGAMVVHGSQQALAEPVREVGFAAMEPRSFDEGLRLAKVVVDSQMFGVKNQAEAFIRISTGMGLGLSSVQSLRGIHVIKGKPGLSADLMMGLCLQSPNCEFFRMIESTPKVATFEAKRFRDDKPTKISFTMAEAQEAGLTSNEMYKRYPAQMLRARCIAALARLVFPEKMHGLYTPEELRDGKVGPEDGPFVGDEIVVQAEAQKCEPAKNERGEGTVYEVGAGWDNGAHAYDPLNTIAAEFELRFRQATTADERRAIGAEVSKSELDKGRKDKLRELVKSLNGATA